MINRTCRKFCERLRPLGDHLWVPWEVKLDMDVLTTFEDLFALLGVSELKPA
jgi:hypothetical protein